MDLVEGNRLTDRLLDDPSALQSHILEVFREKCPHAALFENRAWNGALSSSVMLLLGEQPLRPEERNPFAGASPGAPLSRESEICIILNKRSRRVRQAGDLCCPGGTVEAQLDPYLAKLLLLPGSPLVHWPCWSSFHRQRPQEARLLALLFATALREGWEEMRLNPFLIRFLGPLPSQRLLLFRRIIYPMVGWISWQKRFIPSWEVDKIVRIPLRSLLDPAHYARYRFYVPSHLEQKARRGTQDFPCFLFKDRHQTELLWGATYRIVTFFIELVFGFTPPDMVSLPMVPGVLNEEYLYGMRNEE